MDCFVAFAPLRKRFAFVAGNDVKTHVRLPAAQNARAMHDPFALNTEGAGNAGRLVRPQMG